MNIKLKQLGKSIALAAALCFAGGAQAATYNLGSINTSGSSVVVDLPASGSFSDLFNFTLGSGSGSEIAGTSFFFGTSLAEAPLINFQLDGGPLKIAPTEVDLDNGNVGFGYTFNGLTLGAHTLTISGDDASNLGTNYSLTIAAVPEPNEYAMLLAGLGLMTMVARRRRAPRI